MARRRFGGSRLGGPPEVHAYRVPDSSGAATENAPARQDEPIAWFAVCGETATPDEVVMVDSFAGAPCMTCFISAAMASDIAPVARVEAKALPPDPAVIQGADPAGDLAISLQGREVHRVADDAPRTLMDGDSVVIGLCGVLGWGPRDSAPDGWSACPACDEIAGART